MKNKILLLFVSGIVATLAATPASAQWYIGGAVGITETKIPDSVLPIDGSTASSLSKDESDTVYGIAVGYEFNRNWAIEGAYANNGKYNVRRTSTAGVVGTLGAQTEGTAWLLSGIGKLPIQDKFYLFGKLGIAATSTQTKLDTSGAVVLPAGTSLSRKRNETNFLWGLGAGYDFSPKVGVRVDYTQVLDVGDTNTGEGDINTLTMGVIYRF